MPLVDEQSLSSVDFALPEYDDGDFSADMEPPPDPRSRSAKGERHAEEISKILAETDVYMKYGLHQKAVDHLRRVFTLDDENVEAHERLKDILVSQGREQEAEEELLKLAELVAPVDPDRAEAYLQELLAMNGTHTGAFELARRFRLRVARMSSSVSEVEYRGGGVAEVESDLEELDLSTPPPARAGAAPARSRDSIVDFDADELIGDLRGDRKSRMARRRRAGRRAGRVDARAVRTHRRELRARLRGASGQSTRQVPPEQIEALAEHARGLRRRARCSSIGRRAATTRDHRAASTRRSRRSSTTTRSARTSIKASRPSSARTKPTTKICRSIPTKRARSTPPSAGGSQNESGLRARVRARGVDAIVRGGRQVDEVDEVAEVEDPDALAVEGSYDRTRTAIRRR